MIKVKVRFYKYLILDDYFFIDKAAELKESAVATTHVVEEKAKEAAHNIQGKTNII